MTTIARRTGDTVSDVLGWLEGDPPFGYRGFGNESEARTIPVQRPEA